MHIELDAPSGRTYRRFDDSQPAFRKVLGEPPSCRLDKGGIRLDCHDPKSFCEIKFGVSTIAQADIVNERGLVRRSGKGPYNERPMEPIQHRASRSNKRRGGPTLYEIP